MNNFQLQKTQKKNPMAEYLVKIQQIVSNTEFKNKDEAFKYETLDMRLAGDAYCRAMTKTDIFESYQYDQRVVYQTLIDAGYTDEQAMHMVENYAIIPIRIKNILMKTEREKLIKSYVEENPYYVMLTGVPFQGSASKQPEIALTIPDEFFEQYQNTGDIYKNQPIHELPKKYQELFMGSPYYTQMLSEYPNHPYLRYIGSNSIPIHISRPAKDGEILKINTTRLTTNHPVFGNVTVTPDLIHLFTNVYHETRGYVYTTLAGDFSDIYPNYHSFIRFLTIYMAIGGCMNELMKRSTSMIYMNQSTANDFFMLYGLPSVIMEGPSMISFLKQFRLILMDKGTNIVYRVKDLIGYEYTDIYTLVMVKQQVFDQGKPVYVTNEKGERVPKQNIVFRRLGTTADNTSYFKYKDSDITYDWRSIADGDPRWWNTPEMESILNDMNYTLSNSKYIQLSTHMSMSDIYWECVMLIRGLLDQRNETQYINLNINMNMNGKSELSVFEAVLILEILMNWHITTVRGDSLNGDMYLPNGIYNGSATCLDMLFNGLQDDGTPNLLKLGNPYKVSAFNFDLRENDQAFYMALSEYDYLEPTIFIPMLDQIFDRNDTNIGTVLMGDVKKVYDFLEKKLMNTTSIREFRQVTDAFNHIFLVDPVRNWYDGGSIDVDQFLMETYRLSYNELSQLKVFFDPTNTDFTVSYNDIEYPISLYKILNYDVFELEIQSSYPFQDPRFVNAFQSTLQTYNSSELMDSSLSNNIKAVYKPLIMDKVILDTGNGINGPKTFDALLFRIDPDMYRYIVSLKTTPEIMIMLMRAIVKALETYTNSPLPGLSFGSLGEENYLNILKEVISYFKSYMVEFTREEFVYIFDGLFDYGGNSNMLKLYDEFSNGTIRMIPKDSLALHDAGQYHVNYKEPDSGLMTMYDETQVRRRATYKNVVDLGYDVIFDTGTRITKFPTNVPSDDDKVIFSIYETTNGPQVRIYL